MDKKASLNKAQFDRFLREYDSSELDDFAPQIRREKAVEAIMSSAWGRGLNKYDFPIGVGTEQDALASKKALEVLVLSLLTHFAYSENIPKKEEVLSLAMKKASAKYTGYVLEDYFDLALSAIVSTHYRGKAGAVPADIKKLAKAAMRYASNRKARILVLGQLFNAVLGNSKFAKSLYASPRIEAYKTETEDALKAKREKLEKQKSFRNVPTADLEIERAKRLKSLKTPTQDQRQEALVKSEGQVAIYAPLNQSAKKIIKALVKESGLSFSSVALIANQVPLKSIGSLIKKITSAGGEAGALQDLTTTADELEKILKGGEGSIGARVDAFNTKLQEMNLAPEEEVAVRTVLAARGVNFVNPEQDEVAKDFFLNSEQEDAMKTEGLSVISAGAGSGKTRVLAAKVKRILKGKDGEEVSPYNVIATSFTRDSAQELRERVEASLPGKTNLSTTMIGRTTHSIATELINKFNPTAATTPIVDINSFEGGKIYAEAFENAAKGNGTSFRKLLTVEDVYFLNKEQGIAELSKAQENLIGVANLVFQSVALKGDFGFAAEDRRVLKRVIEKVQDSKALTSEETKYLTDNATKGRYERALSKVLKEDISDDAEKKMESLIKRYEGSLKRGKKGSATDWWHLDFSFDDEKKLPKELRGMRSSKALNQFITKAKANIQTPEQCFNNILKNAGIEGQTILQVAQNNREAAKQVVLACAYKSYQELLGQKEMRDHDDTIIETVRLLSNQKVLGALRAQYKHIIVDEAQDLNPAQHMMFGLLAGTYNPNNRTKDGTPKRVDKPQKSEGEYTLIGDVKQSIYSFRGSDPSLFTHGEDSGENKKDLTVNYRSGSEIVNKMNSFVTTFLGDEAGSLCTPNYDKSKGEIKQIAGDTPEDGVKAFAEDIQRALSDQHGNERYSDFGVAARTNAELIPYAFSLLERGIPFSCSVNPFNMKATRDMVNILKLSSKDESTRYWSLAYLQEMLGYKFASALDFKAALAHAKETTGNDIFSLAEGNPDLDAIQGFASEVYYDLYKEDDATKMQEFWSYLIQMISLAKLTKDEGQRANLIDTILGERDLDLINGSSLTLTRKDGKTLSAVYSSDKAVLEALKNLTAGASAEEDADEADVEESRDVSFSPIIFLRKLLVEGVKSPGTYKREDENGEIVSGDNQMNIDLILEKIQKMKDHAENSLKTKVSTDEDAVILSTIHGWKGLETKHVYVPMGGDKFPNKRVDINYAASNVPTLAEAEEAKKKEEARLAYVAVTRGKESAKIITYNQKWQGGKMKSVDQSEFLNHICTQPDEDND